jgi:hypothetical protein
MEKFLIKSPLNIEDAIIFFGEKNRTEISELFPDEYPCMLIGHYSEDIEFGAGYDFTFVAASDFV